MPPTPNSMNLVCLHGTADTYLVCALAKAAEAEHGAPALLHIKTGHEAVAKMFPAVRYVIDDQVVQKGETDTELQTRYDNALALGRYTFVHPDFLHSGARPDHFCGRGHISHADMFKAILHLDLDAPLERGQATPPTTAPSTRRALIIPDARSWPTRNSNFWPVLAERLRKDGWSVDFNQPDWPLGRLFQEAAASTWVIGPQCGPTAIICHALFPCRKTIVTPAIEGDADAPTSFKSTFPYAYMEIFAGETYDIDEFKVRPGEERPVADQVALSISEQRRAPIVNVSVPMTLGELLDRYSIAEIRQHHKPQAIREFLRLAELATPLIERYALHKLYDRLRGVNSRAWDHNEIMVRAVLKDGSGFDHHQASMRLNKERVEIKRQINEKVGGVEAPKTYYD